MSVVNRGSLAKAFGWVLVLCSVLLSLPRAASAQSGTWSAAAALLTPRSTPVAVVSSGVLYALGGSAAGTVEAYNESTNTWAPRASAGPLACDVNGVLYGATVSNGQISVQRYNAATNAWSAVSLSPQGFAADQLVAIGSRLYFVAKASRPVQTSPFTIAIIVYDIGANLWSIPVGQFQGPDANDGSSVVAANGKIYILGGAPFAGPGPTGRTFEYDPAGNVFTLKASFTNSVSLAGVTALNGKLYLVGGRAFLGVPKADTQVYDIASNTWSLGTAMPTPRFGLGVAALNGNIYAVGGGDGTTAAFSKVEKLSFAAAAAFYRIKNRWQGTYMHTENLTGLVQVGSINSSWLSAQWSIEDSGQGYVRLRNRWTGLYMHIQDQRGSVQYGTIFPQWDSAKWFVDNFNGFKRIRSVWTNAFAHIENLTGSVQYGSVNDTWQSAQWTLEPVQ